jgi:hypothetical protein
MNDQNETKDEPVSHETSAETEAVEPVASIHSELLIPLPDEAAQESETSEHPTDEEPKALESLQYEEARSRPRPFTYRDASSGKVTTLD